MSNTSQTLGKAPNHSSILEDNGFSSLRSVRFIKVLFAVASISLASTGVADIKAANDPVSVSAPAVSSVENVAATPKTSSHVAKDNGNLVDQGISLLFGAFVCGYGVVKMAMVAKGAREQIKNSISEVGG